MKSVSSFQMELNKKIILFVGHHAWKSQQKYFYILQKNIKKKKQKHRFYNIYMSCLLRPGKTSDY